MEDLEFKIFIIELDGKCTPCITTLSEEEVSKIVETKGLRQLTRGYSEHFSILNLQVRELKCLS